MNKKGNESFQALCAIIIAIAAIIVAWQVALPAYSKNLTDQKKYSADLTASAKKLTSVSTNATKLSTPEAQSLINQLNIAIPEDKDMPNLITEIEAIAKSQGMFIPSPSITDGADDTVSISFGISGSLDELQKFMETIQGDLRFFNIKSISMSSSADVINMSMSIEAYKRTSAVSASEAAAAPIVNGGI
jgi:Tfp pilus assembly protein PilO